MVEVRHRLNVRRQKLRERIQANQEQREEASRALVSLIKAYPDTEAEAISILKMYKIGKDITFDF